MLVSSLFSLKRASQRRRTSFSFVLILLACGSARATSNPVLEFSSYTGGPAPTFGGWGIAVDAQGYVYMVGANPPVSNTLIGGGGARGNILPYIVVSKFTPTGEQLVFATAIQLAYNSRDYANAIALDGSGNILIAGGSTYCGADTGAFVLKLNSSGTAIQYQTCVSTGSGSDVKALAVDGAGNVYAAGNWATTASGISKCSNKICSGIAELTSAGSVVWETFLTDGGTSGGYANGIAVDAAGNSYVIGIGPVAVTGPGSLTVSGANGGGNATGYWAKLSPLGAVLYASETALWTRATALDAAGNIYLAGMGYAGQLTVVNGFQTANRGSRNAFLMKLAPDLHTILYSTWLGGADATANGMAVDPGGNAYLVGFTTSGDFPTKSAVQPNYVQDGDAFVSEISTTGGQLIYSTYLGSSDADTAVSVALTARGEAWICGEAGSGFLITDAYRTDDAPGNYTTFFSKISPSTRVEQDIGYVAYAGNWQTRIDTNLSNGSAAVAADPGSSASFNFTGTGVTWIGLRDASSGIANVYVDGALKATVDGYASDFTHYWSQMWSLQGLTNGSHTVTVSATGTANSASGGTSVWVDAFDVMGAPGGSGAVPQPTGGIANAASAGQATPSVVSPGSYVAIYGTALAGNGNPSASTMPLATTLNGTQVTLCGIPLPLLYASATQINALIPQSVKPNAKCPLVVITGTIESAPVQLTVAELQPGIYTVNESGSGAGIVANAFTGQLISASNPAHAADFLVVYCTGLGLVQGPNGEPEPADGTAAPTSPLFRTTATVTATIGGSQAPVTFAGLAPAFSGLYQVNVQVPSGVTPGNAVALVVTATDPTTGAYAQSNSVTVAVQ